ncbi:hypothetical protein HPB49_014112 [Dermacentor silvarum]|uniref:Uncharacterized protein n=1 Tax=Dermacentor silvarum TaxID=543639 RepID=A0ACB8DDS9_DERSI|nr:hypothetical protein HPB49_014112 [Dermacentor silvarum]
MDRTTGILIQRKFPDKNLRPAWSTLSRRVLENDPQAARTRTNFAFAQVAATAFKRRLSPRAPSGIAPFTNEQLFYVSSCFKWCNSQGPPGEGDKDQRRQAVHSDMYKRCNTPLLVEENFLAAFNCTPAAAMRRRDDCAFS